MLTGRSRAGRAKTQSKLAELGKTACFTKLGVFMSRVTQLRAQMQLSQIILLEVSLFTKKKESFNHLPTLCIIDNADTLPPDSSTREKNVAAQDGTGDLQH